MSTTKPQPTPDEMREAAEGLSGMYGRVRDAYGDEAAETFLDAFRAFAAGEYRQGLTAQFEQDWLALCRGEWRKVRARLDEAAR